MDLLSMLMNAKIKDMDGGDIGEVVAIHYVNGKLHLSVDTELEETLAKVLELWVGKM